MIAAVTERPQPAAPSAAEQIDHIAKTFGIVADPNDLHGPDLREQLLSSYIEWLEMERRCASSALWPEMPDGFTEVRFSDGSTAIHSLIPVNTRWGNFHFASERWGDKKWNERPHPLTRAALVLWAVGAINDIPDPLRDLIAAYAAADREIDGLADDAAGDQHADQIMAPLFDRLANATPTPTTIVGAAEALRFVQSHVRENEPGILAQNILDAVIRFLEREGPTS